MLQLLSSPLRRNTEPLRMLRSVAEYLPPNQCKQRKQLRTQPLWGDKRRVELSKLGRDVVFFILLRIEIKNVINLFIVVTGNFQLIFYILFVCNLGVNR